MPAPLSLTTVFETEYAIGLLELMKTPILTKWRKMQFVIASFAPVLKLRPYRPLPRPSTVRPRMKTASDGPALIVIASACDVPCCTPATPTPSLTMLSLGDGYRPIAGRVEHVDLAGGDDDIVVGVLQGPAGRSRRAATGLIDAMSRDPGAAGARHGVGGAGGEAKGNHGERRGGAHKAAIRHDDPFPPADPVVGAKSYLTGCFDGASCPGQAKMFGAWDVPVNCEPRARRRHRGVKVVVRGPTISDVPLPLM